MAVIRRLFSRRLERRGLASVTPICTEDASVTRVNPIGRIVAGSS